MPDRKKKEYKPPILIVYGSIREITNAVSSGGVMGDGGVAPNNKT